MSIPLSPGLAECGNSLARVRDHMDRRHRGVADNQPHDLQVHIGKKHRRVADNPLVIQEPGN